MAGGTNSSAVAAGSLATAAQYNNLRSDVVDTSSGHQHDGTASSATISATTFDGAATVSGNWGFTGTITVGVDDTGKDVKFFGATSGSFLLWDESADALELTDSTPLQIGDGTDMQIYHDGSNSYITNATGALKIATETSGIAVTIGHTTSEVTVADNLTVTGTLTLGSGAELAEAELEMLDGITAGTAAASKALVLDSSKDIGTIRNLTIDGVLTDGNYTFDTSGNVSGLGTVSSGTITTSGSIELGHASDTTLARASSGDVNIEGNAIYRAGGTDVPVADGGTGASSLTDGGVLLGSGTSAVTAMAVLADSEMIVGDGTTDPVAESGATLRTSIGVGTGDSPQFTDLTLTDDLILNSDSSVISLGAGTDATLTHDGTTGLTIAATPISIDATGELHLNSTTGDIKLQDGGTDQIAFDLDGTAGAVIIKPMVDSDDLVIQQYDGTEVLRVEDAGYLNVSNSTASSSATTGSGIFGGGIGVAADAYVGDDVYLISDSAVLGFGADKDTTLTHTDGSGLTLNSTNKIMFNDASQFIQGSSATVLSLGATDEIDLTATALDLNGTLDVSGAAVFNTSLAVDNITLNGNAITSSGNTTINTNAGNDVIIGDDANLLYIDGGQWGGAGSIGFGAANIFNSWVAIVGPATTADADNTWAWMRIRGASAVTIPTGTANHVASLQVAEPNITATGTVNHAATVWIENAPDEATNDYALKIDSGVTLISAGVDIGGTTPATNNRIDDASNGSGSTQLFIGNSSIDVTASDQRLKDNITAATTSFAKSRLAALNTALREYDWNSKTEWNGLHAMGMVAQILDETLPQYVRKPTPDTDKPCPDCEGDDCGTCNGLRRLPLGEGELGAGHDSNWSVDYHYMVPYLIRGYADLEARVAALES